MTDAERIIALQAQVKALWGVIVAQQRALEALQGNVQPDLAVPTRRRISVKPGLREWYQQNPGVPPPGIELPPPRVEAVEEYAPEPTFNIRLRTPEEQAQMEEQRRIERQRENELAAELRLVRERRFIYFVQVGEKGPIKIGITKDIKSRFSSLQVGHPEPLRLLTSLEGPKALERELHNQFHTHRLSGEWFKPAPELLAHIAALNGAKQSP